MNVNLLSSFERTSTNLARTAAAALAMAIAFALAIIAMPAAQAQTYQVIHSFNGADGSSPYAGLTMDAAGNFYGTTAYGGSCYYPCGTVFKMSYNSSGWRLTTLYGFTGPPDGGQPSAEVVFGTDGSLYGTTFLGGVATGCGPYTMCGTVFKVRPSATPPHSILDPWTETVLYRFASRARDAFEPIGPVVFDQAGNMYGTTNYGGASGYGAVYELAPSAGGWKETVLHSFSGGSDGRWPYGALIFDHAGNLYGTTWQGGTGAFPCGTVYELMPSESGWTEKVLYNFSGGSDGCQPAAGLIFDQYGNLYGTTSVLGDLGGGTVFELTPSNGDWVFTLLASFPEGEAGPVDSLTMDVAGSLYGTTVEDGAYGQGNVFKLSPGSGGWTYASLYDFTGGSDGGLPISNVNFDTKGNLYGTAYLGGDYDGGVVWEITP